MTVAAQRTLARWLLAALLCAALVALSIAFVDRPLAALVHREFNGVRALHRLANLPSLLIPLAVLAFAGFASAVALGYRSAVNDFLLRLGLALIVCAAIKDQLKFLSGRTWPESWLGGNPSYIAHGVFGFWPLHGGIDYSAFPSGHTAITVTLCTMVALRWPRLRWLCALAAVAAIALLVGGGFHWLSDSIAGAFLGAAVGIVASRMGARLPQARGAAGAAEEPATGD